MTLPAAHLRPLGAIHFLIHPLFDAFMGLHEKHVAEQDFGQSGGWKEGYFYTDRETIREDLRRYALMVPAYLERASAIRPDEALLTFLPFERGALRFADQGFASHYDRLMAGLRVTLGRRQLLFHADVDPVADPDAANSIPTLLKRRGWSLPKGMPSYAFGETMDHCIPCSPIFVFPGRR